MAGLIAIVAMVVVLLIARREAGSPPSTSLPPSAVAPLMASSQPQSPPSNQISACCMENNRVCPSGRHCEAGPCAVLPQRTWKLRVAGAAERHGHAWSDLAVTRPAAGVCVTTPRSGEECFPLASPGSDPERLPVATTTDLIQGRIGLHISDGGNDLEMANADLIANADLTAAALCAGLTMTIGPAGTATGRVTLYLDDL